jgi:sugar phosphate isomerase/epimerase
MAPGMGRLDWKKIVTTLKEIGYNEVLSVEFCSPLDRTPANPYPNSIEENPQLPKIFMPCSPGNQPKH